MISSFDGNNFLWYFLLFWLFLFTSLLLRDVFIPTVDKTTAATAIAASKSTIYQGVYFKKEKIGSVISKYKPLAENRLQLHQTADIGLNVAGKVQRIQLNLIAEMDGDGSLQNFHFRFHSPFYSMQAEGIVHGKTVEYQLNTGSAVIKNSLQFPQTPILTSSRRGYLLTEEIEPGEKRKIPWFDPFTLSGKESIVQYRGIEPIRINGRVRRLHRFSESLGGSWVDFWLDEEGNTVKEKSPAGFVFIKEPKFKALAKSEGGSELLAAVAVKSKTPMPENYTKLSAMRYQLEFPAGNFCLNSGLQSFADGVLTVEKESRQSEAEIVRAEERQASPAIQRDAKEIIALSKEISKGAENDREKAVKIMAWLAANIKKQPVLGLPDAVTVLHTLQGDCNEFATLFAALARAAGIPCRIAAGVVYTDWGQAFYYHAWNELFLDGRWLAADAALNQIPADISHIKFVEGELSKQTEITALIGRLRITIAAEGGEEKSAAEQEKEITK